MPEPKTSRLRISLSHFLVLITGVAIGFAPIQWWRSRQPPPVYSVTVHIADLQLNDLSELGLPASGLKSQITIRDIEELLLSLNRISANDERTRFFSTTFTVTEGHIPKWLNGGGIDLPVMADDGTVAIVERYDGDIISVEPKELANGNLLLAFDITSQNLDYGKLTKIGGYDVYPQFTRQLKTQVEIPKDVFVAVPAGRRTDSDGVERELVFILSAKRIESETNP